MAPRVFIGSMGGTTRVRLAKPGFDASNPNLSNEQLVYDSGWSEILSVHQMSWNAGARLASLKRETSDGFYCWCVRINFPALPWAPLAMAWRYRAATGGWDNTGCFVGQDYIDIPCSTNANYTVAYVVLNKPLMGADSRESDNGGVHQSLLGNHPSRGSGLWISRRGADVLTCGDNDLTLSTLRPALQVAESGVVAGGYNSLTRSISVTCGTATSFSGNRPLPLVRGASDSIGGPMISADISYLNWNNDNSFNAFLGMPFGVGSSSQDILWTILDYDSDYSPGGDSAPTPRVLVNSNGLFISKKNVDVRTAGPSDYLLRTDRSVLHVAQRGSFTTSGAAQSGTFPLSTVTARNPLVYFGYPASDANGGWICRPMIAVLPARGSEYRYPTSGSLTRGYLCCTGSNTISYFIPSGMGGVSVSYAVIEHS